MSRPSGENRGNGSSPRGELRRFAVPPVFGTTHTSPAYTNAIWVADTSGCRSIRASICPARKRGIGRAHTSSATSAHRGDRGTSMAVASSNGQEIRGDGGNEDSFAGGIVPAKPPESVRRHAVQDQPHRGLLPALA